LTEDLGAGGMLSALGWIYRGEGSGSDGVAHAGSRNKRLRTENSEETAFVLRYAFLCLTADF
jgi:hypothetical protein